MRLKDFLEGEAVGLSDVGEIGRWRPVADHLIGGSVDERSVDDRIANAGRRAELPLKVGGREDMVIVNTLLSHELAADDRPGVEVAGTAGRTQHQADETTVDGPLARRDFGQGLGVESDAANRLGRFAAIEPSKEFSRVLLGLTVGAALVGLPEHRAPEPPLQLLAVGTRLRGPQIPRPRQHNGAVVAQDRKACRQTGHHLGPPSRDVAWRQVQDLATATGWNLVGGKSDALEDVVGIDVEFGEDWMVLTRLVPEGAQSDVLGPETCR